MIFGMSDEEIRNCGYATHLPILGFLLNHLKPVKTLEWGMGDYSTPLLIEKTEDRVLSIEMTSVEWFEKISYKYSSCEKFKSLKVSSALEILPELPKDWDLVFNDGDAFTRHIIAQQAQYWDTVVVSHDTQEKQYFYNAIVLREGWVWMDIMDYSVWTSVLTTRPELLEVLSKQFRETKQYRDNLKDKYFTHDHGRAL